MPLGNYVKPVKSIDGAQKGKWAEAEVQKIFRAKSDDNLNFTFNRTLDARSAGGKFPAQAGDFQWFRLQDGASTNGIIEVKEVQHLYRLPYKNFDKDAYARMRKRELAGSRCIVVIAHKLKDMKPADVTWRILPLPYFADRNPDVGSWDLSEVDLINLKTGLANL